MVQSKDIRFVRIKGRIVPIRKKSSDEHKRKIKTGAALIGSGAGISAAGGYASGRLFKSAAKTGASIERSVDVAADLMVKTKKSRRTGTRVPKGQMSFAGLEIEKAAKQVPKYKGRLKASGKLFKATTLGLGAILIGEGLQRAYEGIYKKETGLTGEIVSTAAGVAAIGIAQKGFRKGAGKALLKFLKRGK